MVERSLEIIALQRHFFFLQCSSNCALCFKQFEFNLLLLLFFANANVRKQRIHLKCLTRGCECELGLICAMYGETFICKMKNFEGFVKLLLFAVTEEKPFIKPRQEIYAKSKEKNKNFSVN